MPEITRREFLKFSAALAAAMAAPQVETPQAPVAIESLDIPSGAAKYSWVESPFVTPITAVDGKAWELWINGRKIEAVRMELMIHYPNPFPGIDGSFVNFSHQEPDYSLEFSRRDCLPSAAWHKSPMDVQIVLHNRKLVAQGYRATESCDAVALGNYSEIWYSLSLDDVTIM